MATRNIVPRADGEGSLGTSAKKWGIIHAKHILTSDAAAHNSLYRGAEITDSWATIQANIQAGDFSNYYIGDYKTINLTTGEVVICEVAGIDHDTRGADTEIGGHIDFISRDCLATAMRFNPTNTNNGTAYEKSPWLASELYQSLNDETNGVFAKLPSDLKPNIITKRTLLEERYSAGGAVSANTGYSWKNAGKLWLPTEPEVFDHPIWSEPGYGTAFSRQYPIFAGGLKHIIKGAGNGGSRCDWWELSAFRMGAATFCSVHYTGNAYYSNASITGFRVPLCFRIA